MTTFDLHKSMVHMHVLYQLDTGNTDSGAVFVTWFWVNKDRFPGAMDEAVETITSTHVGDDDGVTADQMKAITWELASRLKIADTAIRGMAQPIIVGGVS